MFGKKKSPAEILPEDRVVLKPILGIRPGVYLASLYALILLIILFFVLLYPGLANPGSVLSMASEPSGAAVRVDDGYRGTTPCAIFVPQGKHRIEMTLPGFTEYQQDLDVRGRLFGSAIVPLGQSLKGTLEETKPGDALLWGASDYATWSFTGEPTITYQIPRSLSEGAYRSGPGASDQGQYQRMEHILKGAARFASTKAGLRDLIRGKCIIDNGGLSPSPVSLVRSVEDTLVYLSATPGAALWLRELLPPETASVITDSAWYTKQRAGVAALTAQDTGSTSSWGGTVSLGLLTFRELAGGTLIQGGTFPLGVPLDTFSIAETEVSAVSWEAFLKAHPEWGLEHRETLLTQGLITEDYLAPTEQHDFSGVSGVSWYAAQAYCQWLTSILPPGMGDYEVRLPTEAEWEYAAKASAALEEGTSPLKDMLGGLWEWCEDPYAPNYFLPADPEIIGAIGSPERAVRGNSWINLLSSINEETRGSLFPASCSPFGSFRPVLVKKVKKEASP
jgi:hypothetical protein